jgi:hypothetical protein
MEDRPQWGISPVSHLQAAKVWWGARAIYDERTGDIDLLWNRMGWNGLPEGAEPPPRLVKWLDSKGLPKLRAIMKKSRVGRDENFDTLVETKDFFLVANPRKSFGYLYIGAWEKEKP